MSLHDLSNTIDKALAAAGLDTRQGPAQAVLATIRNALEKARITQHGQPTPSAAPATGATVVDAETRWVDDPPAAEGRFLTRQHTGPAGSRSYKLYVPASHRADSPMPLVVMLHGCQQNPDDFAAGTRLNELAEEQGFLVAYPAQTAKDNGSNCWNWFEPRQQSRGGAEPALITGIVREIHQAWCVDERRVFVAGLSAGAAMAVILGQTHPEVFAAVGAHSGLPRGAAHDVPSAFAAMHGAAPGVAPGADPRAAAMPSRGVPTIVFHGERDSTVVPRNGTAIVQQALAQLAPRHGALTPVVDHLAANGRPCTRTRHLDGSGLPLVEHWAVQGGGHAWFGGSRAGSFVEPQGPDASREMLRFFALHSRRTADDTGGCAP